MTFPPGAAKKRAKLSMANCFCDKCGQPLPRKMRIKLGQPSELDDIGKLGGEATLKKHGREHYVMMGKRGGRPRRDREQKEEGGK